MAARLPFDPEEGRLSRSFGAPGNSRSSDPAGDAVDYRTLIEQIPCITYTQVPEPTSPTGFRDMYISPQCEAILGYTSEEWQADPTLWATLTHPDDRGSVIEEDQRAADRGDTFRSEYRMIAKDGRVVWFRDEAVRVQDPVTGGEMWQGVMTDVTQEKLAQEKLREAETRYRSLVESFPAVIFVDELDENSTNIYTSPKTTEMLGYSPEEWCDDGELWRKLIHPDDVDRVLAASRKQNESGELFDEEYRMIARDGRLLWVRDVAVVLHDDAGKPLYSQGFFLDISAQKEAEEAVRGALLREQDTAERLRDIDEMKNTVLRALSHDVRNPLTSVLGFASTLQRPELRLSVDEQLELFSAIEVNARKILKLLTDLLDLERLEQGVVELQHSPTDLGELARRLVASCSSTLEGRDVEVNARPVILEVDAGKVERMLENLLVNAVRHTPADARIFVRIEPVLCSSGPGSADEDELGGVLMIVEDEGPGVPDDLKQVIFEPFRRGDQTQGSGTGVGLSLVARFAKLHGGRAWVEDRPGGGASFRVFLPVVAGEG